MEIQLTVKNGQLSESIQQTMKQKVAKLPRYFERTTGVQILASLNANQDPMVELVVSAEETNDFFASSTGSNVIAALDVVIGKIEQQLRKHKDKITDHRG